MHAQIKVTPCGTSKFDAATQRHTDTRTQPHRDTPTQGRSHTEKHRHKDAATQRHTATRTQPHRDTPTHGRSHTETTDTRTQPHRDTPTQGRSGTVKLRHSETVAQWHSERHAQRQDTCQPTTTLANMCEGHPQRQAETVNHSIGAAKALWHSGTVALTRVDYQEQY
jgi:hypothetical protein